MQSATVQSTHSPSEASHHPQPARLSYLDQNCSLTLREGLEEYYTQIEGLITEDNSSSEAAKLFRYHDTCHVLFGSDTSIPGEILADSWILAGTDQTLRAYLKYFELGETKDILATFKSPKVILETIVNSPLMIRAWWRSRKMTELWPFSDHDHMLDTPLHELRDRFNIRVITV